MNADVYSENERIMCPDCDTITCITCKAAIEDPKNEYECEDDEHDEEMRDFIALLPADRRWLWQQCYRCRRWVEKIEACNHKTCRCGAEFCLVCGCNYNNRSDQCLDECPSSGPPLYDADGYDHEGFNRAGFDRRGRDYRGLSRLGSSAHHVSPVRHIERGWEIGPDGNARRWIPESPPASVNECNHVLHRSFGPGSCMCCLWEAKRFVFA